MRCETCKLIQRPDIAKLYGEEWCRCDPVCNQIYDYLHGVSKPDRLPAWRAILRVAKSQKISIYACMKALAVEFMTNYTASDLYADLEVIRKEVSKEDEDRILEVMDVLADVIKE